MVYKWYILPIGGLYVTYHLLREPETTIDCIITGNLLRNVMPIATRMGTDPLSYFIHLYKESRGGGVIYPGLTFFIRNSRVIYKQPETKRALLVSAQWLLGG